MQTGLKNEVQAVKKRGSGGKKTRFKRYASLKNEVQAVDIFCGYFSFSVACLAPIFPLYCFYQDRLLMKLMSYCRTKTRFKRCIIYLKTILLL